MSENIAESSRNGLPERGRLSPVLQFVLLIVPVVMNGFFIIYAVTGWLVEGQYRINWSIEAPGVALYVGAGMALFSVLVLLLLKWRGVGWRHPLGISSIAHGLLAIALAAIIVRVVNS